MKLNGQRNQCPACSLYFNSNLSFDMHRVGPHGTQERRCLNEEEMLEKGMAKNADGFWVSKNMPDSVLEKKGVVDQEV